MPGHRGESCNDDLRCKECEDMTEVTKETFEQEVVRSDIPVVVDFWGPM